MSGRVFSISLDDLTFAKLGQLQKKYPKMSRNGMIRHIISLTHSLEDDVLIKTAKEKQRIMRGAFFEEGCDDWNIGPNLKAYQYWIDRKGYKLAKLIDENKHKVDHNGKWLNE
jgi:hypothetical protein